jgi:hypothetical protein
VIRAAPILTLSLLAPPLAGQSAPADSVAGFVGAVREATARYRDRSAAIADGYRQIGPDFPSMGQHWISVPLVVRDGVDPLRPPILEYVTVGGKPVLAGVAYVQLIRDGMPESPLPAPAAAWHYHAGSVDEESFILGHVGGGHATDSTGRPRVAVLHAWVWLDNPAGIFATDNWTLPWYRLGIEAPPGSGGPSAAGSAAALAAGGESYFLTLLRLRNGLSSDRAEQVGTILARYGREWRRRLASVAERRQPQPVAELADGWSRLEAELRSICNSCGLSPHAVHADGS